MNCYTRFALFVSPLRLASLRRAKGRPLSPLKGKIGHIHSSVLHLRIITPGPLFF